jgi:hypothetical protein
MGRDHVPVIPAIVKVTAVKVTALCSVPHPFAFFGEGVGDKRDLKVPKSPGHRPSEVKR